MISLLITLLIIAIIVVILCYVVDAICSATGIPAPVPLLAKLVIGLVALAYILHSLPSSIHLGF